jgi:hypothetical protein
MKISQSNGLLGKKSNRIGHVICVSMLLTLACSVVKVEAKTADAALGFEAAFNEKRQPTSQHFTSTFRADGTEHKLEVWRLNDERLKRVTDGVLEVYVERKTGDPEFHMTVLDVKKRLLTQIDRSNLYRIGNFTDWFDLAHGIKHPKGVYQLAKGKKPEGVPPTLESCEWFDLTQGSKTNHICWSSKSKLPMLISAQDGQVLWQITQLDRKPVSKKTFEIHDEGFIRNDANQDIEHD